MPEGRCLCGRIRWSFEGEPTWSCFCHCDDCRRNCAAPVVAFLGVPVARFVWKAEPEVYESSPGVRRLFCGRCGTPMAFEADRYAGEIHLYAASLEEPEDFAPRFHVHHDEALPWLHLADDLPRHKAFHSGEPK